MADDKTPSSKKIKRKSVRTPTAAYALKDEDSRKESGPDKPESPKNEPGDDKKPEAGDASSGSNIDSPPPESAPAASPEPDADAQEPAPELEYVELLRPRDIAPKDPQADAPPPKRAPRGDSRSFRRAVDGKEEFCLVYRSEVYVITRRGPVGKEGTWEIVQYPSLGAAAHAYALKGSELSSEGFRDFR